MVAERAADIIRGVELLPTATVASDVAAGWQSEQRSRQAESY
jgi:hypothetical protein